MLKQEDFRPIMRVNFQPKGQTKLGLGLAFIAHDSIKKRTETLLYRGAKTLSYIKGADFVARTPRKI